jgi:urease accessory protein UreH
MKKYKSLLESDQDLEIGQTVKASRKTFATWKVKGFKNDKVILSQSAGIRGGDKISREIEINKDTLLKKWIIFPKK